MTSSAQPGSARASRQECSQPGTRSRRAGVGVEEARARPLYARILGLQFIRPSSLMCFLFFEGSIALAVLLALAELVNLWALVILPLSVAVMVKLNDVIAGASKRTGAPARPSPPPRVTETTVKTVVGRAAIPLRDFPAQNDEWLGSPEQRARQSAARRYE